MMETPKFNPNAKVVREIKREGRSSAWIMNDGTFRIYNPAKSPKDPEREHFAVGVATGKTDEEIDYEASCLLTEGGVQFFHKDGTSHK